MSWILAASLDPGRTRCWPAGGAAACGDQEEARGEGRTAWERLREVRDGVCGERVRVRLGWVYMCACSWTIGLAWAGWLLGCTGFSRLFLFWFFGLNRLT